MRQQILAGIILSLTITPALSVIAYAASYDIVPFGYPGADLTYITGINDVGDMVGEYDFYSPQSSHHYLYSAGTFTDINYPGAVDAGTIAWAINNHGQIVGYWSGEDQFEHGFLYDGDFTSIDVGSYFTEARGINNLGQIVGLYADSDGEHGFIKDGNGIVTLDVAGALITRARSINDNGQVVGSYYDQDWAVHGFLFANGVYTPIDNPNAVAGFQQGTYAAGINNSGQIVGTYHDGDGVQHGYLYENGVFTTLDWPYPADYPGTSLQRINNQGVIVGVGGFVDGLIATPTPVPLPAVGWLLAPAFGLVGYRKRRVLSN